MEPSPEQAREYLRRVCAAPSGRDLFRDLFDGDAPDDPSQLADAQAVKLARRVRALLRRVYNQD